MIYHPKFETKRLILRKPDPTDAPEILKIRSNVSIAKYLNRPLCKSLEEAQKFIHNINTGINKGDWFYWVVSLKINYECVGTTCLWKLSTAESKAEIGFELLPKFQHMGFMTEAVETIIRFGFKTLKLDRIEGETSPENVKSVQLLKKFGFVLRSVDDPERDKGSKKTHIYFLNNQSYNFIMDSKNRQKNLR